MICILDLGTSKISSILVKDEDTKPEVVAFSSIEKDRVLDKHDPIRITLDEDLIQDPIHPEEIEDSLAVFDDTDTIRDARLRNSIVQFLLYGYLVLI